ncbi:MAG: S8 family serine peptidase [Candidatus Delongbacteria bacterium]
MPRCSHPHVSAGLRAALAALLLILLLATQATAGPATDWVFRCADAATARRLLEPASTLRGHLPAGARLEQALPGTPPPELAAVLRLSLPAEASLAEVFKHVQAEAAPHWLESAPLRQTDRLPDDPLYSQLWSLPQIQAPAAWDLHVGQGEVLLAVVDTGVELSHPDLAGALWTNPVESTGLAGVDDDGNGIVDDLHGADLLDGDGDPSPAAGDQSHGTHTAGTAACVTDNGAGLACPAWSARLLAVRAGHQSTVSRGVEGIWYAAQAGARIISCSWGGDSRSTYEDEVIQAARALGALVVASAGNDGTERLHYPGAYDGVLCVAASTPEDTRLAGSQVGWWVDLCAPGSAILSSVIGGGYGLKSGTSMATPLAASLCALASSRFPGETGDQLRERVKAGCDNVDEQNPGLEGKLGSGRLNAWRTLSQSPRAVQLEGFVVADADADGVAEPGEAVQVRLRVRALLGTFGSLQAACFLQAGEGTLQDGLIQLGALSQGQLVEPTDAFSLTLASGLEPGQDLRLHLLFTAEGGFSQGADLLLRVAPTYVTHDNSRLQLSVGGAGVQGYYDFEQNQAVGDGLRWPPGSPSHLYHGSLLLALADGQVAHNATMVPGDPAELLSLPGGEIRREENAGALHSEAEFSATGLAGLRVRQDVHSWPDADWVLLRWTLQNTGSQPLSGLQPGLWLDLDVAGSYNNDTGGWDSQTGTGWITDAGGLEVGARWLSEAAWAYRLCHWSEWSGFGLEDGELFGWLNAGFGQTATETPADQQILLGAAPLDLAPGQQRELALVLCAGSDLEALRAAGQAALDQWEALDLSGEPAPGRPGGLELGVAPNPFNPDTRFQVTLPRPGALGWRVYDLRGRLVLEGRRAALPAGLWTERLALSGQASGLYLLVVEQGPLQAAERLLLIR